MTSRMLSTAIRMAVMRSMPSAMPPCGGAPNRNAFKRKPNLSSISFSLSCKKGAGEGGSSSITGKLYGRYYNPSFTTFISATEAPRERIYIIYGDDITFGDNQQTSYDGSYEFKYLRKGHYKIYAYSKDSTQNLTTYPSGRLAIIKEVDITDKKQTIAVPNIVVVLTN